MVMRRLCFISMALLGALLLASSGWRFGISIVAAPLAGNQNARPVSSTSVQTRRANTLADESARLYVGAGGCAAAACHGDATAWQTPSWKSSYSRWISQRDPHSIAYAVLKSDAAKRMVWLLDGGNTDPQSEKDRPWSNARPHRDARCLTCHSITPDAQTELPENLLADGVSCEGCHGPAGSWVASHTTAGWLARGPKRYQGVHQGISESGGNDASQPTDLRMWNTKDLASRANVCVRCHVGGADRDVNHDLIAAGHPRLNFEYHAFMQNLPKHWDDERDRERLVDDPGSASPKAADYEARLWGIGQAAAAEAALRLLDERVQRSIRARTSRPPAEVTGDRGWRHGPIAPAWPELAEYSCYACHRGLQATSVRAVPAVEPKRPLGSLPWGTWYFSDMQRLSAAERDEPPLLIAAVAQLRQAMESPSTKPDEIAAVAAKAASTASASKFPAGPISRADIEQWLEEFRELPPPDRWDEATQRYLALQALTKSHQRLSRPSAQIDYEAAERRLAEVRKELQFDAGSYSPRHISSEDLLRLHKSLIEIAARLTP